MVAPPRLAKDMNLSRVWTNDVHQDPNERALARAVRTQQAEDLAGMDIERDAAQRFSTAVGFHDVVEGEHNHWVELTEDGLVQQAARREISEVAIPPVPSLRRTRCRALERCPARESGARSPSSSRVR